MKYFIFLLTLSLLSCDKIIELPPNNSFITKEDILSREVLMESYIGSLYDDLYLMLNNEPYVETNLSFILGAFADEFSEERAFSSPVIRSAFYNTYYSNESGEAIPDFFTPMYKLVVRCNIVLTDFLEANPEKYRREIAEVKAIRAIVYFYLTQLYKEIPLLISGDLESNFSTRRSDAESINEFCIKDLKDSYENIGNDNLSVNKATVNGTFTERINRNVVAYYLSAFCLLSGDYTSAIEYGLSLKGAFGFNQDASTKFELSSTENVWLLNPSVQHATGSPRSNNPNAAFLHYRLLGAGSPFNGFSRPFAVADALVASIAITDKRRVNYLDSVVDSDKTKYLPFKYRFLPNPAFGDSYNLQSPERFVLIRLPAVYFNLMEAYYQNNQRDEALAVFNEIGRINYIDYVDRTAITLEDIVQERFKELFAENGDRWFTLKRTGLVDKVMSEYLPLKNNNAEPWNQEKMLYLPIPFDATNLNPNL